MRRTLIGLGLVVALLAVPGAAVAVPVPVESARVVSFPSVPYDEDALLTDFSIQSADGNSWWLVFDAPFSDVHERWAPRLLAEGWEEDTRGGESDSVLVLRRGSELAIYVSLEDTPSPTRYSMAYTAYSTPLADEAFLSPYSGN